MMTLLRVGLAVLLALAAVVLFLDWRASRATGRSMKHSLTLVPSEAQRVFTTVKAGQPIEAVKGQMDRLKV